MIGLPHPRPGGDATQAATGWRTLAITYPGDSDFASSYNVAAYYVEPATNPSEPAALGVFSNGAWFLDLDSDGVQRLGRRRRRRHGVFSGGLWLIDRNGDRSFDPATEFHGWGEPGWTPVPGRWQ